MHIVYYASPLNFCGMCKSQKISSLGKNRLNVCLYCRNLCMDEILLFYRGKERCCNFLNFVPGSLKFVDLCTQNTEIHL